MYKDWNFWFSIITALTAVFALIQSRNQIKLSNKQHLFDKRIENYLIAMGLIELYKTNNKQLKQNETDKPFFEVELTFVFMTNNSYLEQITPVIKSTLEEPYHKKFLIKLENIKNVAAKIMFLFSGNESDLLGNFVLRYQILLSEMYKYKILLDQMNELTQNFKLSLEESQERIGEKEQRAELYDAFIKLRDSYEKLEKEKVEEKIKKQIKL